MIFIDSNIPMYLVGAAHPHKIDAQRILEEIIAIMKRYDISAILTFDKGFQQYPGIGVLS